MCTQPVYTSKVSPSSSEPRAQALAWSKRIQWVEIVELAGHLNKSVPSSSDVPGAEQDRRDSSPAVRPELMRRQALHVPKASSYMTDAAGLVLQTLTLPPLLCSTTTSYHHHPQHRRHHDAATAPPTPPTPSGLSDSAPTAVRFELASGHGQPERCSSPHCKGLGLRAGAGLGKLPRFFLRLAHCHYPVCWRNQRRPRCC